MQKFIFFETKNYVSLALAIKLYQHAWICWQKHF